MSEVMTQDQEAKVAFLARHGAGEIAHSAHSLLSHLLGVQDLLTRWGARQAVADAGLFHSVYGTELFPTGAVPKDLRAEVQALIGVQAEWLAFVFADMTRQSLYDNLFDEAGDYGVTSRTSDRRIDLTERQFADLCDLVAANWLEQRARFPEDQRLSASREFREMLPYLSPAAAGAIRAAYAFAP